MRFLMRVTMPVDTVNKAMKKGTFGDTMGKIMAELKPEAAYFTAECGHRSGYLIVNMKDANEMMKYGEPFFHAFEAEVDIMPVMTAEEIKKGGAYIEDAVKKFG